MEIPTNFGEFKARGMVAKESLKVAIKNRDWWWLTGWFFYLVVGILIVSLIGIGAVVGGLEAIGIVKDNIFAPKRELVYDLKTPSFENPDGSYTTVFSLILSTPIGGPIGKFIYSKPKGCEKEPVYIASGTNQRNGTIYAETQYEVTCTTKEQIVENYRLFELQ